MCRHPLAFGAVSSLVLSLAIMALWVRSYVASDALDWGTATGRAGMSSFRGRLSLGRVIVSAASLARIPRGLSYRAEPAPYAATVQLNPSWSSWTGFQVTDVNQPGFNVIDIRIPYWILASLTAMPAGWWMLRHLRQPNPGLCPTCGYDLRASPDRCPECGRVPTTLGEWDETLDRLHVLPHANTLSPPQVEMGNA
jgi:hypothetical protein